MIENFIKIADNLLNSDQNIFLKELVDNHNLVEKLPPNKPAPNGRFWQPRSDHLRKDSQFVLDPFWPQLSSEINNQIYEKLLIPYIEEFSTLQTENTNYINGSILIQKTEPSEGYHLWHSENHSWKFRARTFAWMIYLNDVEEGGETEFLYQKIRIKPKSNMGVLWPGGFTHTHRGNPPLSGTKYILTGWICGITHNDIMDIKNIPPIQPPFGLRGEQNY